MNLNENELEKILRNPPQPKPAAELKRRLMAQIEVRAGSDESASIIRSVGIGGWLRRWWPALAPATVSVACAVVMVSQQIEARDLRQSNDMLAKQIATERARIVTPKTVENPVSDPAADAATVEEKEIARLRERAAQLAGNVARLEAIQKENEAMRKQPLASTSGLTGAELAGLEKVKQAKEKAMSIHCISNLKQIGLAAKMWALEHKNIFPPDFLSMSNELNTPKILVCPGDTNRVAAAGFAKFTDENCSYELLARSESDTDPYRVFARCPIHGHIGLSDGSVHGEVARKNPERLVERDQKLYLEASPR
jgi:hypothetical protein